MNLKLVAPLLALLITVSFAQADEASSAEAKLKAEIARMSLLADTQREIIKARESRKYRSAERRRDAQLRVLVEADLKTLRSTSDWSTASKSQRRKALEAAEQLGRARIEYEFAARSHLLGNLCLTPQDVNNPDSSCYKVLYSPTLVLPE